jgi:hypothetical protein
MEITWKTQDGRIILKWILEKWCGGMDWMHQAQDGNRLQAFVNAVVNLCVAQNAGNFLSR